MDVKGFKDRAKLVVEAIEKGKTLANAMKSSSIFPEFFINMILVAEKISELEEVINKLAYFYDKQSKLRSMIISSMVYPMIVILFMIMLIAVFMIVVVPSFLDMYANSYTSLPFITKLFIGVVNFLSDHMIIIIIVIVLLLLFTIQAYATKNGRYFFHLAFLHMPFFKHLYIKFINIKLIQVMAVLLKWETDLENIMLLSMSVVGNDVIKERIAKIVLGLKQGYSLSHLMFSVEYFLPMTKNMIILGEETGAMAVSCDKTLVHMEYELDRDINNLNKLIEPLITVVIGLTLIFIMLAVMLPIMSFSI
jgi:type IV pilus assembly protein PilC